MKTIKNVAAGEIIKHIGDLIIENNVGAKAEIYVEDGSLTIRGDVADHAKIKVAITKEYLCILTGKAKETKFCFPDLKASANWAYYKDTFIAGYTLLNGHVNIKNRIYVDGSVKVKTASYHITNCNYATEIFDRCLQLLFTNSKKLLVKAFIDNKVYLGQHITVSNNQIKVDGKLQTPDVTNLYPKLTIKGMIANNVELLAPFDIVVNNTGKNCRFTSMNGNFTATNLGEYSEVKALATITLDNIADHCQLISYKHDIIVNQQAHNDIYLRAQNIYIQNVGDDATLIATTGDVNIKNLGKHAIIKAYKDIRLAGECVNDIVLSSVTGEVKHAKYYQPQTNNNNQPPSLLNKFSLLAKPLLPTVKPLESLIDPISFEPLKNPVLCKLDGKTYEKEEIVPWLTKHRTSPYTRAQMAPGQTVDDVLICNLTVKEILDEVRTHHPQLLDEESCSIKPQR